MPDTPQTLIALAIQHDTSGHATPTHSTVCGHLITLRDDRGHHVAWYVWDDSGVRRIERPGDVERVCRRS